LALQLAIGWLWLVAACCSWLQVAEDDRGTVAAVVRYGTGGKEGVWQGPVAAAPGGGRE